MRIGFFDSGLGGLTIMRAVEAFLPQYEYVYYGDTKHLPYGDRTEREIYELTRAGIEWLFQQNVLLAIIACNTASSETLRKLQDTFLFKRHPERKILGVIVPTIEEVIERKCQNVLLIGTRRTIESKKYHIEMHKKTIRGSLLHAIATPELVPRIEAERYDAALDAIRPTLNEHVQGGGDGLILGCTHYCTLKEQIRTEYGSLRVFAQDEIIPTKLEKYLELHPEIEKQLTKHSREDLHETLFTTA